MGVSDVKFTFNLAGIHVTNIEFHNRHGVTLPLPNYRFQIILKHGIDSEKKLVLVLTTAIIKNMEETIDLGVLEVAYAFMVENFEEIVTIKGNDVNIDERVLNVLHSIVISTTRGIAFEKFQNTGISNAIMPIYDLSQLKAL
jgi:hypothetical protein